MFYVPIGTGLAFKYQGVLRTVRLVRKVPHREGPILLIGKFTLNATFGCETLAFYFCVTFWTGLTVSVIKAQIIWKSSRLYDFYTAIEDGSYYVVPSIRPSFHPYVRPVTFRVRSVSSLPLKD